MGTKMNPGAYDCYSALGDDEPFFVLRAKDKTAPILVRFWVQLNLSLGTLIHSNKGAEANKIAQDMEDWANRRGSKFPD